MPVAAGCPTESAREEAAGKPAARGANGEPQRGKTAGEPNCVTDGRLPMHDGGFPEGANLRRRGSSRDGPRLRALRLPWCPASEVRAGGQKRQGRNGPGDGFRIFGRRTTRGSKLRSEAGAKQTRKAVNEGPRGPARPKRRNAGRARGGSWQPHDNTIGTAPCAGERRKTQEGRRRKRRCVSQVNTLKEAGKSRRGASCALV